MSGAMGRARSGRRILVAGVAGAWTFSLDPSLAPGAWAAREGAGSSPSLDRLHLVFLDDDPVGLAPLLQEAMAACPSELAAAEELRVPMPLASLLHDRFLRLLAQGGDHLDWSALGGLAAQDAGGRQLVL